jgi:hypothetical protein
LLLEPLYLENKLEVFNIEGEKQKEAFAPKEISMYIPKCSNTQSTDVGK